MVLFYDKDGTLIEKAYECSWSFSQKRNKEGTGKLELLTYPHGAKYAELYKDKEKIQTAVITDHTRNGVKIDTNIRTLETLLKNYRLPTNWNGWHKRPLSFILSDAVYGFDYIRKSSIVDFTDYIEKVNVDLNKIKDGDIHLALHTVGDSIQYHEMGYITFAFDCGDAVSQRYVRWVETTGEKVYIGIQSVASDTPIVSASDVDFSNIPILTINRSVEHDSEVSGVPIASDKRYVSVRFILKYINADWIQDFATHKVYNENNVLVDRTIRGFTPVIRAFEIITRKKTEFTVRSSPTDMGEFVEGIDFKNGGTLWEAIQKIRERYPFDTVCSFEDGTCFFDFARSLVKDKKMQAEYLLRANDTAHRDLNNTSIKALKQDVLKVNVLHCYGEGEKQQQLYVRIPAQGTYDGQAAVEDVFTDTSLKTKEDLQNKGLKQLLEKRKEAAPVFEVETLEPIRLFDEVSLVHPETNTIYESVVEEEHISYKNSALTQKFSLGGFLFNPIDALIKKDKQSTIREYALQPFGLTAYGKSKSIILVWKGQEDCYSIKWKKKTDSEYNIRHVQGFATEFESVEPNTVYLFSVAGVNGAAVSDYTAEIEAHTVQDNALFTWIKFAFDADGMGMSDYPDGGRHWMGIAHNKLTAEESDNPKEYTWVNVQGEKGSAGPAGKDGKPRFIWVKYADDAHGNGLSDNPDGKDYIGFAFNKETEQESDKPADYYWQKVKGEQGVQGIPGKDGSTKFLTSLEITGDYENQIGTFQGRLYRWTGSKWELLNAVMPLNPVAHYDMADIYNQKEVIYTVNNKVVSNSPEIIRGKQIYRAHFRSSYYHIHIETTSTGDAKPTLIVYREDWAADKFVVYEIVEGTQDFYFSIPQQNFNFGVGVWMHGWGGYEVQPDDSVTIHKFTVTEITNSTLIDSSGNKNHMEFVRGTTLFPKRLGTINGASFERLTYAQCKNPLNTNEWSISMWIAPECINDRFHHLFNIHNFKPFIYKYNFNSYTAKPLFWTLEQGTLYHFVFTVSKNEIRVFLNMLLIGSIKPSEVEIRKEELLVLGSWKDDYGFYNGFMGQVLLFDRALTEQEILYLYLNPQYPVKNYTLADWAIDPANPDSSIKNLTPKYLGVIETVPTARTVFITKGERLWAQDANPGDWVLMAKTIGGWKCGVCYRWTGSMWEETKNPQYSQATLTDALDIVRNADKDADIPAVQFTKKLVALEAFVESLSAQVVYFQKSVASLVSGNPKVGDQIIFMGHNYRQYDPNEPFSFGIDELTYKGTHNGKEIEIWRELMRTKQIKNIAGASILSLFLTGCIQAGGGVELPAGNVISVNKIEVLDCSTQRVCAVTKDGQKAICSGDGDYIYSDDGLKTFKEIKPAIKLSHSAAIAYQDMFYAVKEGTADYYSSLDGIKWTRKGIIAEYHAGDSWVPIFHEAALVLGFVNFRTGERKYFDNPHSQKTEAPKDKPDRLFLVGDNNLTIAWNANAYTGLSISHDKGETWEHLDTLFLQYGHQGGFLQIIQYNKIFYLWFSPLSADSTQSNGYYTSNNGKDWELHRAELKSIKDVIQTSNNLILVYDNMINSPNDITTSIENLEMNGKNIQKIPHFKCRSANYYPQIHSVVMIGSVSNSLKDKGAIYVLPTEGVLTGSGITNFETADNYLAAQFGNGLQMVTYNGNNCPKPFVGRAYTFNGTDNDKLRIGRWF